MPRAAATAKKAPAKAVEFSQELFDRICELIASGGSVRSVCAGTGMPDRMTFNRWRKMTPELQAQYDQACLDRADAIFDEILEIADDSRLDTLATEKNGEQMNTEWVTRSRLRVDARKWVLARMNRKKYGDHVANEHSGPDGGPITTRVVRLRMQPVEELPE
ncbi:hypothetical protein [Burkholderia cenocepacia]|uniref:terminase small subunit-like protein n=1 Tax=Burkholderia cenocepacia TaxID=95486 RepID=UPI002019964F|nr:hypothetical protein [Burkholderia cenocepacia]MCO1396406.1 hypothetical protein [Burkholderia cenocepacia]MCO1408980.1 hypothetical protein [Burkholderia cenocepacia]UQN92045.1 hypothetical protein L0Z06_15095 [Burkholderia cenocepacia]UQN99194.1 hypothetical protein L0Z39_16885 [Burkholderia cenocepacia]UQP50851.1 hypothetical protein L0Y99_10360 [Burkholderia cenocepacia]